MQPNPDPNSKALATAVYIGMVQNILSKATKYAVFDPTKEMAYIPLDRASKVKGKAAIGKCSAVSISTIFTMPKVLCIVVAVLLMLCACDSAERCCIW
jgi:ATP/ADP translocase